MLQVGDLAPDFQLHDQDGHTITLSEFKGKSNVVLFFYPKDHSTGCTAQSCSFRDNYLGFKALHAQVLGISRDSLVSHLDFAKEHRLPYPLLSDPKGVVSQQFGVKKSFGLLPGRVTYVVDTKGVIRYALSSQFQIQRHIDESLETLHRLNNEEKMSLQNAQF